MRKCRLIALLLIMGCGSSSADELLIAGRVEKVADRLADHGSGCKEGAGKGGQRVCVSNSCGIETSDITIDRLFAGTRADKALHIETPLGEWCKPLLAISPAPVLIQLGADQPRWSPIIRKNGKDYFKPGAFQTIAGVDLNTLPADADGLVALDRLLALLPQASR